MTSEVEDWGGDATQQPAMEIEEVGRDFYEALGSLLEDPRASKLCRDLEGEEADHCRAFRNLHSRLAERGETVILPAESIASARQAARQRVMPGKTGILRVVSAGGISDVFAIAIGMERDANNYYRMLARQTSASHSDVIQAIIREEERHLDQLLAASASEN